MAGGAVVAAAAAAHAQRIQEIVDAFRLAGATDPTRARSLEELGLAQTGALEELRRQGVVVPLSTSGPWYLSESAYIARRDARPSRAVRIAILAIAIAVILAGAGMALFAGH